MRRKASPPAALTNRRVLDLADTKGAYCGKLFADMGAEVITIEAPGGDAMRSLPPFLHDTPEAGHGFFHRYMNANKLGVTLDLSKHEGREIFRRLTQSADLIIETRTPGELNALGLGFEALRASNPKLVMTSITGFGQTGPHRGYRCSEIVAEALGGSMIAVGEAEDPPVMLAGSQAFVMASTLAAASSMMALLHASLTGRGQHVDISVQEAMLAVTSIAGVGKWLDDGIVPKRFGSALFASTPSGAYPCRDGPIYLMVNRPHHWETLAQWVFETTGNEEILDPMFHGPSSARQPYRELLDLFLTEHTQQFDAKTFYREAQERHLAVTPVQTARAVVEDAHLHARGFFVAPEEPEDEPLRYPGAPYRHEVTPWRLRHGAPNVGEHNSLIYGEQLGMSAADLRELSARGVI